MTLIIGIARTIGLRGLAGLLGWWLHPLGRAAILAAAALAAWVGVRAYWISEGRDRERAEAVARTRQAEAAADAERLQIEGEMIAAAARDAAELAAIEARERELRDASAAVVEQGGRAAPDVLWRADDSWLRGKAGAGTRR